jgi:hypothetical protein
MKIPHTLLALFLPLCIVAQAAAQTDKIISKHEADMMFSLNHTGWEAYARQMTHPPQWQMRLTPHETGTSFAVFDSNTGVGLTVQPLFANETDPPAIIVIGSWYRAGRLRITPALIADIERAARADLGPNYSVEAAPAQLPGVDGIPGIELKVTQRK